MQYRRYTKADVINITRESIHLFVGKQIDKFLEYLDEGFVFVADYNSLYLHGISEFLNYIKEERELPPVNIEQEEYEVISHERHLWVICGRYIVSIDTGGRKIASKHHFTFTWKQIDHDLRLLHAMACHAKDFPSAAAAEVSPTEMPMQAKIFDVVPQEPVQSAIQKKVSIRDISGKIRYLYADEIIYVQADNKVCHIYTAAEHFSSRITLNSLEIPGMISIHKSYRVNKQYIKEIQRYQATLSNGTQLPIGKSWYMELKKTLE